MNKIYILLIVLCLSCSSEYDNLRTALNASGDNRKELEKVLSHYSSNKGDSLKLCAARFLIENMPGHYTHDNKYIRKCITEFDSLNPNINEYIKSSIYSSLFYDYDALNYEKVYDITIIKSDFLIKHIDYKFYLWKNVPWYNEVSFDVFCETILPYRIDIEPIINPSYDSIYKNIYKINEIVNQMSYCDISIFLSADYVANKLFQKNYISQYKLSNGENKSFSDCIDRAYSYTEKMKLIGVPSTIDFFPHWARQNGRHYFNTINNSHLLNLTVNENNLYRGAKIYRKTYSHNLAPKEDGNYIPNLFSSFHKDVTSEYIKCSDVTVRLSDSNINKPINAYLCVFNDAEWRPVAWSDKLDKGNAQFKDLGNEVVYQPVYYKKNELIIAGVPFILKLDNTKVDLIPNKQNTIKLHLTRKHPMNTNKLFWMDCLEGAKVIASNDSSFRGCDTIGILQNVLVTPKVVIKNYNNKKYSYFKLVAINSLCIAELTFRDNRDNVVIGQPIMASIENKALQPYSLITNNVFTYKIFDNNPLTFTNTRYGDWVGMKFERPTSISTIEIIPRNDGNYIYPNNVYELFYSDVNGWVSMGTKKSTDYFIEYDNVPSGALYWLRNLTEGREERIFTYENGKMKFW